MKNTKTIVAVIVAVTAVIAVLILRGHKPGDDTDAKAPAAARTSVAMAQDVVAGAGIQVAPAGAATLEQALTLPGTIALNEEAVAHVVPRLTGFAREVRVHLGDRVRQGEVLAVLDSEQLANLRSDWLEARDKAALARTSYEREKSLWDKKITSEQDYLAARQAQQLADIAERSAAQKLEALGLPLSDTGSLTRYELRAPLAGEIVERDVIIGEPVAADAKLFVIADLAHVWAEFNVPAQSVGRVREGQTVTVTLQGDPQAVTAPIAHVSTILGEDTRGAHGHAVLPNPDKRWHPGQFVSIAVQGERSDVPLAVPLDAVQELNGKPGVFVRTPNGFDVRTVTTGARDEKSVEIREGLKPGEQVAVNPSLLKADLEKSAEE